MVTSAGNIKSCYIGPEISPEQFIAEHFFLYLAKGKINGYDGHEHFVLNEGEYCLVRKNRLARYNKEKVNDGFEKVVVMFDENFLRQYAETHKPLTEKYKPDAAFILLNKSGLVPKFISSLVPYYDGAGKINDKVADKKRNELLTLLLKINPGIDNVLFNFGIPQKIDIEAFMNRNFRFNVAIQRFAYLTGRSLSSFKRDFAFTFNETPSRWLVQKRLKEAYFLMKKKGKKASDVYIEVGFEDLSHFSFAFKKMFGINPTHVNAHKALNY